ncbi:UNVERIFIED_CONTAM: hypothetical protein GTU68_037919 [Idotea baltica]|nr:hypothetical protein [Idotea baltica]
MINDLVRKSDTAPLNLPKREKPQSNSKKNGKVCNEDGDWLLELDNDKVLENLKNKDVNTIARLISLAENNHKDFNQIFNKDWNSSPLGRLGGASPVLGITGTGGAGKSSLVDELVRRFLIDFPEKTVGLISVDPSKRKTGGALLGDRIRMNAINDSRVYMRSLATRQSNLALSKYVNEAVEVLKAAEFDLIILETSGIGQSDTEIIEHSDTSLYVMTPEFGAATQLEKIDMLDFADLVAINKFDKRGALDALRDVKKQYMRNNNLWHIHQDDLPVYGTIASQFNDPGMNTLYKSIMDKLVEKTGADLKSKMEISAETSEKIFVIPPKRVRYLSEIAESNRSYDDKVNEQVLVAQKLYGIYQTILSVIASETKQSLLLKTGLDNDEINWEIILNWSEKIQKYKNPIYTFKVRDKEINIETHSESLSHSQIPKVALPKYQAWGDLLRWNLQENVPGEFPFSAGLYPFKRTGEDPTRMFAGEGGPERTNRRFHYVSLGMDAKRLSTAFDSVTLYGNDPGHRPDIYGKIGNAGVSICCLDDAKKLYSGFDLSHAMTSVSMTINGPAPMLLGFFMNAAIDQNCEKYIKENKLEKDVEVYQQIKKDTLAQVRGTVQADILKEDQAQNTCIFSTEFALRLMGDVQEYFIEKQVRNFYSVSISGYHIAEAGANPITQLALTLSNGLTYVEYYLSRGMDINKFGPNLSFFFSNGIDPEYSVIGRVARKIWAKAMKLKYGANSRAQMLKYHIQTSGRSLHAQEIDFNDIRTTLQALYAINDNCNSLHTNAYDEAITTPTEESVRRAMAIQLIINKELGLSKNENPIQGAFIIEELTDLVEEAVLQEFDRITERGGVLGAMETMYQRSKIQEESLYYETLKHNGDFPIIGVNTFLSSKGSPTVQPAEVIRATEQEKQNQIKTKENLNKANEEVVKQQIAILQEAAIQNENLFDKLMEATKVCSLGQITEALFKVGGQYRRNM